MTITGDATSVPFPPPVRLRTIGSDDLRASLSDGWADFKEQRGDILLIGLLYPLVGFLAAFFALGALRLEFLFPVFAGLTLLGPLVAIAFYEIARRRERGEAVNWRNGIDVLRNPALGEVIAVGAILFIIFAVWMIAADIIYSVLLGPNLPTSLGELVTRAFTTPEGWAMMLVGDAVGLVFAILVLAISTISLPMLIDGRASAGKAVSASIALFRKNPATVLRWGLTVAVLLVLGAIPFLIGLAVVLPVLGYATWHLYTRAVERDGPPPVT